MNQKSSYLDQSRREFFSEILPAGSLFCLGCGSLLACARREEKPAVSEEKDAVPTAQHKFLQDSGMSLEQVYNFAFKEHYIPIMQALENEIGKDEFIETLKRAGSESAQKQGHNLAQSLPKNDLASFADASVKEVDFYKHVSTYEIVEETDKAFELKITECLWAKTFCDADASNIGYAAICHPEYAFVRSFNPKMKMIRAKTLMQGHECCNPRYVLEV